MAKKQLLSLIVTNRELLDSEAFQKEVLDKGHKVVYMDITDSALLSSLGIERCDAIVGPEAWRLVIGPELMQQSVKMMVEGIKKVSKS